MLSFKKMSIEWTIINEIVNIGLEDGIQFKTELGCVSQRFPLFHYPIQSTPFGPDPEAVKCSL